MIAKRAKPGDILKIPVAGGVGYAKVIRRDNFGLLLIGLGKELQPTAEPLFVAYVNPASIPKDWEIQAHAPPDADELRLPPFFFGSSSTFWTIQDAERESYINGSQATSQDLVKQGYVHKVLWLARDIAEALDGKPLTWPFDL